MSAATNSFSCRLRDIRSKVPWDQDRLVPIFLATLAVRQQTQIIIFQSAAEMLDVFGMQQGGSQYRRLVGAFQRVFGATIFFGSNTQHEKAAVMHQARFNFMREARIWYSRDPNQTILPGAFENEIVLSDEFFREVTSHSIPTDLEAAKALSSSPAALDVFMWLSYRCFTAKGPERIPIFGDFGLGSQLGSADYARPAQVPGTARRGGSISFAHCGRAARLECPGMATTCYLNQRLRWQ